MLQNSYALPPMLFFWFFCCNYSSERTGKILPSHHPAFSSEDPPQNNDLSLRNTNLSHGCCRSSKVLPPSAYQWFFSYSADIWFLSRVQSYTLCCCSRNSSSLHKPGFHIQDRFRCFPDSEICRTLLH